MQTASSQALVTIFKTMPKTDQKAFFEWIKTHEKEIETDTFDSEIELSLEKGASETEIRESVQKCFGMWKNRQDFKNFQDFRQQAWGGRGV